MKWNINGVKNAICINMEQLKQAGLDVGNVVMLIYYTYHHCKQQTCAHNGVQHNRHRRRRIKAMKFIKKEHVGPIIDAVDREEPLLSHAVLGEGWHIPEDRPKYYKPIIMFIETKVLDATHELYIAGYYHTDEVWLESCGGNMEQEFDNYRLKAWAYIKRPAFA